MFNLLIIFKLSKMINKMFMLFVKFFFNETKINTIHQEKIYESPDESINDAPDESCSCSPYPSEYYICSHLYDS